MPKNISAKRQASQLYEFALERHRYPLPAMKSKSPRLMTPGTPRVGTSTDTSGSPRTVKSSPKMNSNCPTLPSSSLNWTSVMPTGPASITPKN
jgi:hypothetical protein